MAEQEWVTRRELDLLKLEADRKHAEQDSRLLALDQGGSRGVIALQVQIQDMTKDVVRVQEGLSTLKSDMDKRFDAHAQEHKDEARARVTSRRWLVGSIIAAVASVDGPLVTLLLSRR